MGYAGGDKENPTYHSLGNHTETVQLDYDPDKVSYSQLLDVFWNAHYPTSKPWSRQYMSIIFYHNDEQKKLAEETKAEMEARLGTKIYTEIIPYKNFYLAEDYHQKYYLQHVSELMQELSAIYPNFDDFVNSTVAARLNGYAGGYGTIEGLQQELESYGLSDKGQEALLRLAGRGLAPACATQPFQG